MTVTKASLQVVGRFTWSWMDSQPYILTTLIMMENSSGAQKSSDPKITSGHRTYEDYDGPNLK